MGGGVQREGVYNLTSGHRTEIYLMVPSTAEGSGQCEDAHNGNPARPTKAAGSGRPYRRP